MSYSAKEFGLSSVEKMLWLFDPNETKDLSPRTRMSLIIPTLYFVKEVGQDAIDLLIEKTSFETDTIGQVGSKHHGALAALVHKRIPPSGEVSKIPRVLYVSNIPTALDFLYTLSKIEGLRKNIPATCTVIDTSNGDLENSTSFNNLLNKSDWPHHAMLLGAGAVNKFLQHYWTRILFIYDEIWVVL